MKKLLLIIGIAIAFTSCKNEWKEYVDISATGVHIPPCSSLQQQAQQQQQQQTQQQSQSQNNN